MQHLIGKKYIFADMDGTLTNSRREISTGMLRLVKQLGVIPVSGASKEQMQKQLGGGLMEYLAQSGNDCSLWQSTLTDEERSAIYRHIANIVPSPMRDDHVEDRGCQITLSMIGHNASYSDKQAYDTGGEKRLAILDQHPFCHETVSVRVAGSTSLDYTTKNKGENLQAYIKQKQWPPTECVYIGDALYKGGNDETVIGVMDTVQVHSPVDTLIILHKLKSIVLQ